MKNKILIITTFIVVTILIILGSIWYNVFYRTEGFYFDHDGVKIHYTVEGEGEPVILIHGFAVNGDMNWRRMGVNRALRKEYKVITIDTRGHGLSDKPYEKDAYGEKMAWDVIELLNYLDIKEAHLVGYSLGGFIALKCVVSHPSRWKSLTIMGSAWEDYDNGRAFRALKMVEEAYRDGKPLDAAMDYFEGKKNPILIKFLVIYFSTLINDVNALGAVIGGLDDLIITQDELKSITLPICGIVGDKDPFIESARAMEGRMPNYELVVVKGGDHLNTPRKNASKRALLKFLNEH